MTTTGVTTMAQQFTFRLIGVDAPDGELEADHLIGIVQALKDVATRLGRVETDAAAVGRPPERTRRVATFTVGLVPGSTTVLARRAGAAALDFDLADERAFDEKFQELSEAIGADEKPSWVGDSLAGAADSLRAALAKAAPRVEFGSEGRTLIAFDTAKTHRETWTLSQESPTAARVTFVGRLRVVNLDTQRLQVTDDLGQKVALPQVENVADLGPMLDSYVEVEGVPERDLKGRIVQIREAEIRPAEQLPEAVGLRAAVSLEEILSRAPGPELGGVPDLTDAEVEAYFQAIGR